ncbi:hypothetical protein [Pseudomonas sp. BIC9C]|uniref:hypothetical protein n=1 Tax=Pseudomonas sp. BIC9C TaxID=3078458 RepID=UPI002AD54B07|nr:hypothetical protein [Pseudomonas sp. BIC9C]
MEFNSIIITVEDEIFIADDHPFVRVPCRRRHVVADLYDLVEGFPGVQLFGFQRKGIGFIGHGSFTLSG